MEKPRFMKYLWDNWDKPGYRKNFRPPWWEQEKATDSQPEPVDPGTTATSPTASFVSSEGDSPKICELCAWFSVERTESAQPIEIFHTCVESGYGNDISVPQWTRPDDSEDDLLDQLE